MNRELFWANFVVSAEHIRDSVIHERMREAFSAMEQILTASGYDLAFDLTADSDRAVLILTPEGDSITAQAVDSLLANRPEVAGWQFYGRRQRKTIEDALTIVRHVYGRDASDAVVVLKRAEDGFDAIVESEAMAGLTVEEAQGLAATLLDHLLGEEVVMSRIGAIQGTLPSNGDDDVLSLRAIRALLSGDQ